MGWIRQISGRPFFYPGCPCSTPNKPIQAPSLVNPSLRLFPTSLLTSTPPHLSSHISSFSSSFLLLERTLLEASNCSNGIVASLTTPHSPSTPANMFLSSSQTRARLPWIAALCGLFLIWSLWSLGVNLKPFTVSVDVSSTLVQTAIDTPRC